METRSGFYYKNPQKKEIKPPVKAAKKRGELTGRIAVCKKMKEWKDER